jgi:hypothetical protein
MSTMTDQIDFVCIRGDHQATTPVEGLTFHDQTWAYCPSAQSSGHEWRSCRESGLQAHVILRHREQPEWALTQSVHLLAVEHAIAHANGARHRRAVSSERVAKRRQPRASATL